MTPHEPPTSPPRSTPRGGYGNADPAVGQMRRAPLDLVELARWNTRNRQAREAYEAHEFNTHAEHNPECRRCGLVTLRVSGLCLRCEKEAA